MYQVYLGDILLPVTPAKIQTKINGQNKTANLINGEEINILAAPGLIEISFEFMLPHMHYPFANYEADFEPISYYTDYLQDLMDSNESFSFTCIREGPGGDSFFDTDIDVTLESYKIVDDAGQGLDVTVSVELKQYVHYGTQTVTFTIIPEETVPLVETTEGREAPPPPATYTVASGDCLWNIAKKTLGNGARYTEIYDLNRDKISNPNLIYPGQVLTLPG